jgi:hypothetical protein
MEKRPHCFDRLFERNAKEWDMYMHHVTQDERGERYGWGKVLDYIGVEWRNPEQYFRGGMSDMNHRTAGRPTGLVDGCGTYIHEGDVVIVTNGIEEETYSAEVLFDEGEWRLGAIGGEVYSLYNQAIECGKRLEVIGNVSDAAL